MSEIGNELTEMMLKLGKRNQEIMNDILNQQKEMIRDLETERPKGKMAATHQLSEKSLLYVWDDETFKCTHMRKKIDDLEKMQLSMKLEFDDMGLSKYPVITLALFLKASIYVTLFIINHITYLYPITYLSNISLSQLWCVYNCLL